ncbi:Uncharacterised protein [Bordetella pertussis]|nr:Uncharacterised protein [Bordetella pertussis]CFP00659.1 Uncharacterised protein [Bordetella pertussis]CRE21567.1 Uncharacterised protein [Bordetella pertussis]CRE29715.1 Uncharacterised protein [Bordetella pertussis]
MSLPWKRMAPLTSAPSSSSSRRDTAFSVVDLPAPLLPSKATMPPRGTSSDRPRSTCTALL